MEDSIVSDILDVINEEFYLMDTDFDPNHCDILFSEIYRAFKSSKNESQVRIELLKFVKNILEKVERYNSYDYTLFLKNINLLPLSFIKKRRIISAVEKQTETKKIG